MRPRGSEKAATRRDLPIKSRRRRRLERGVARIFIISAHAVNREALRLLLEKETGFRVVGGSADCVAAAQPARGCHPDVLLVDLAIAVLPDGDAVRKLATACAPAHLVVLAPELERSAIAEALRLGVRGVVSKSVPVEIFLRSIRAVVSGQYWVGREVVADLVQSLRSLNAETPAPRRGGSDLTARQLEVLSVLVTGCANKEIARRCSISERTVKHHLTAILRKLGLTTRLELAVFALQHRLVVSARSGRAFSTVAR